MTCRLHRLLTESSRVTVVSHTHPDGDAVGSSTAMCAFLKALGTGLGGVHMRDIVIGHTPAGAPYYVMNGPVREALKRFDADSAFLSISHDGGIAAAFCVISRGEGGPCSDT